MRGLSSPSTPAGLKPAPAFPKLSLSKLSFRLQQGPAPGLNADVDVELPQPASQAGLSQEEPGEPQEDHFLSLVVPQSDPSLHDRAKKSSPGTRLRFEDCSLPVPSYAPRQESPSAASMPTVCSEILGPLSVLDLASAPSAPGFQGPGSAPARSQRLDFLLAGAASLDFFGLDLPGREVSGERAKADFEEEAAGRSGLHLPRAEHLLQQRGDEAAQYSELHSLHVVRMDLEGCWIEKKVNCRVPPPCALLCVT